MIREIGNMNSFLIGISLIGSDQGEALKNVWEKRFECDPAKVLFEQFPSSCTATEVIRKISDDFSEKEQGATETITVAFFANIRDEKQVECLVSLGGMLTDFSRELGRVIESRYVFVYVGKYAREDESKRKTYCERIKKVTLKSNVTLLVGNNALAKEERDWQAEVAFLDLACRGQQSINLPGYFGFFSYGKCDEKRRGELEAEKEKLGAILGNNGEIELRKYLRNNIDDLLVKKLGDQCEPDKDMIPVAEAEEKKFFFSKQKPGYTEEDAKKETRDAVLQTAKYLEGYLQEKTSNLCKDTENYVPIMLKENKVGFELIRNKERISEILRYSKVEDRKPILDFGTKADAEEMRKEAYSYLQKLVSVDLEIFKEKYYAALKTSYLQVADTIYSAEEQRIRRDYNLTVSNLEQLPDEKEFLKSVLKGIDTDKDRYVCGAFSPVKALPAQKDYYVLWGIESKQVIESLAPSEDSKCYLYHKELGVRNLEVIKTFVYSSSVEIDEILHDLIE